MKALYFDHQAASYPDEDVSKAMQKASDEHFASPLSPYKLGQDTLKACREPYQSIYQLLGSSDEHSLVLCGSGAEAINQVIWSVYLSLTREEGKNHFLCSQIDEAPAILGLERLGRYFACSVSQIPVDAKGAITKEALIESITPKTALLSLSYGNGVLGTYQNLDEIISVCKERGVFIHLDVTHSLGKVGIDFDALGVDYLTFHGEQIHGPKSVGALLSHKDAPMSPLVIGGAEQKGKRGGSWDVSLASGLGVAADKAIEYLDYMGTEMALLRDRFEEKLSKEIEGVKVHFQDTLRLPNISVVSFPYVNNDALLYRLSQRGVYASFGGGNFQQVALLLEACGIEKLHARGALSFSLARWHTERQLDELIDILKEEMNELKALSTYFKEEL